MKTQIFPVSTLLLAFSLPVWAGGLYSSVTSVAEPAPAAFAQLGISLHSSGVALSADGQTALVTAPFATVGTASGAGKAYIWHLVNGQWTLIQEIDDPGRLAGDEFGESLALSADGTAALIGSLAVVNGQTDSGKAYLYTLSNGTWTQSHVFDSGVASGGRFGAVSVGLSGNGTTAVIGAFSTGVNGVSNAGEAYIFSLVNGVWTGQIAITDPDAAPNDEFGVAVGISGDGSSVLIGSQAAVAGQANAGKAYLYTLNNGIWTQTNEFDDPAAATGDEFGFSGVALSNDGSTVIVGAAGTILDTSTKNLSAAGAAYIFNSDLSGNWYQAASISDPDETADDEFGYAVALSGDGTTALIGSLATANGQSDAGKAYLYTLSGGTWPAAYIFDNPAAIGGNAFGASGVALSYDGEAALINACCTYTTNTLSANGEAYLYLSPDDLSVSIAALPASVSAGQQISLDITITNNDTAVTANGVTLTDTLPSGLTFAGTSAENGACSTSGATVTCTLASLGPGQIWQPAITVNTAGSAASATYSDTVAVTSNEPDPDTANNSATVSIGVQDPPPPSTSSSAGSGSNSSSSSSGGGGFGLVSLLLLAPLVRARKRRSLKGSR